MDTLTAILNRRSIRKFKREKIPDEFVDKLLQAAMYAPSAQNTQSWHFIKITDRELLNKIPTIHPYAEMCYEAPLAILVCGDKTIEKLDGYIAQNCAAATQNILLAAFNLGLGSVWLGVYPRIKRMEPISKLFKLPPHILPVSLVAIGYPDETKARPERFNKYHIHKDTW